MVGKRNHVFFLERFQQRRLVFVRNDGNWWIGFDGFDGCDWLDSFDWLIDWLIYCFFLRVDVVWIWPLSNVWQCHPSYHPYSRQAWLTRVRLLVHRLHNLNDDKLFRWWYYTKETLKCSSDVERFPENMSDVFGYFKEAWANRVKMEWILVGCQTNSSEFSLPKMCPAFLSEVWPQDDPRGRDQFPRGQRIEGPTCDLFA